MKPIDYLRFAPAIIFCVASVVGWLLDKPDFDKIAFVGIGCFLFALGKD